MEEQQAEAIAQAILEPDLSVQAELRRKREAEERSLAVRRARHSHVRAGWLRHWRSYSARRGRAIHSRRALGRDWWRRNRVGRGCLA